MSRLDGQLRALFAIVALDPCCLCEGESDHVAVFMPDRENAADFGVPPGKRRMIAYAVCDDCIDSPGARERVADVLRQSSVRILRAAI
jgi:hypothetical protein